MRSLAASLLAAIVVGLGAGRAEASLTATRVTGKVEVQRAKAAKWTTLDKGGEVQRGDVVRTAEKSRVELTAKDGSRVRLAPKSTVEVARLFVKKSKRQVGLRLRIGRLWAEVTEALGGDSSFEVETANAIAGVRGTSFAVLAHADASALVRVYTGTVGVKGTKGAKSYAKRARKRIPGPARVSKTEWEEVVAAAMTQVEISALGDISPAETFEDEGDAPTWAAWDDSSALEP